MSTIVIRKKVNVPEKDILEVITAVTQWFSKNPERKDCNVSIFGYKLANIKADNIEQDVRKYADNAHPYKRVKDNPEG